MIFKKAYFFFFLVLLFFVACQDLNRAEQPKNLISEKKMEEILTDMIILDAIISVNSNKIDEHQIDAANFIYRKHQVDSQTLAKNIEYYNEDYQVNAEIYARVKENIEELKQKLEVDKKLKDSLRRELTKPQKIKDSLKIEE